MEADEVGLAKAELLELDAPRLIGVANPLLVGLWTEDAAAEGRLAGVGFTVVGGGMASLSLSLTEAGAAFLSAL